jgi:hypothetical protein
MIVRRWRRYHWRCYGNSILLGRKINKLFLRGHPVVL